jgi:hypothetical protein
MADLVRVDLAALPAEPAYRPVERQAWYSRSIPLAMGLGALIGMASAHVSIAAIWLTTIAMVGWLIARRRRIYRFLRDNDDGVALLGAGELEEAAGVFDRLCAGARLMPHVHSLFVYNRGVVHLERGELDRAVGLLSAVVHAGWIAPRGALAVYYPNVLARLAMAEALRGHEDLADSWRIRAHAVISVPKRGMLLLVDAIVEARHERHARVIELVDDGWMRAENLLNAKQLRAIRLIEAYCLERAGGTDYRAEARSADLHRALDAARRGRAGEFDFLAVAWPELRQFMARHGLLGATGAVVASD